VPSAANRPEVTLAPESTESLQRLFESELRFRRAFVAGRFPVRERQRCFLVVAHPQGGSFSVEAEAVLLAADVSRARRKQVVDKMAAAVILQRWLDANREPRE